jgi:hypothetical protein
VQLTGAKTKFTFGSEHKTLLDIDLPALSEEFSLTLALSLRERGHEEKIDLF